MSIKNLLLIIIIFLNFHALAENQTYYRIGLLEIPNNLNVLSDRSLSANLLRSALYSPLIKKIDQNRIEFLLSDSFQRSADGLTSSFRLRKDTFFSNNKRILGTDVINSLQDCRRIQSYTGIDEITSKINPTGDQFDIWIDIKTKNKDVDVLAFLESCTIMDQEAAKIFRENSGVGTHIIGSGKYKLIGWEQGRRYSLAKVLDSNNKLDKQEERTIDFVQIASPEAGLSTLRRGELDLLFIADADLGDRIAEDSTLAMSECNGQKIVKRKNLSFVCNKYNINKLSYDL